MSKEKARKEIDKVDEKLLELLNKRVELAKEIGKQKKQGKEPVYDPVREEEVIEKLLEKSKEQNSGVEAIFREIFSVSRKAQRPITISYLGPETTFTHGAAIKQFGSQSDYLSCDTIKEVFLSVEKGNADYGVVPIENSLEGSITHTYDMFLYSNLNIVAEISEKIHHNLLSKYKLSEIKKLFTHPMAYAQCKSWIAKNIPNAEVLEVSSTAKSAESAALYINSAGIGSELAAVKNSLKIIAKNIQKTNHNFTRFLVIGKSETKKSKKAKTSIVFSVKNKPGALFEALETLKNNKINLTKIESRPTKNKNWEYVFFIDFQGYKDDKNIIKALNEMENSTIFVRVLGSYPEKAVFE